MHESLPDYPLANPIPRFRIAPPSPEYCSGREYFSLEPAAADGHSALWMQGLTRHYETRLGVGYRVLEMGRLVKSISVGFKVVAATRSGTRLDTLPLWCGTNEVIGVDEVPAWRDWTEQETTRDQLRIEEVLDTTSLEGNSILHVGIGNSSLAVRFHASAKHIDGITTQENEYRRALGLGISNYSVVVANKYAPDLALRFARSYDFVVDNNPTTFCCCRRHLAAMLASYDTLLRPGGVILTDTLGLGWTSVPNDPRWKLTASEWTALGALLGLVEVRYTEFVVGLRKASRARSVLCTVRNVARQVCSSAIGQG